MLGSHEQGEAIFELHMLPIKPMACQPKGQTKNPHMPPNRGLPDASMGYTLFIAGRGRGEHGLNSK